jgi:hypothetical protein
MEKSERAGGGIVVLVRWVAKANARDPWKNLNALVAFEKLVRGKSRAEPDDLLL